MSRFEVDSQAVAGASASVRSSAASVAAEVDRMMRNLLDLQSTWKGQASAQFAGCADEWRTTQERVRQSLEHISQALGNAATNYDEVEQSNTRMFAG